MERDIKKAEGSLPCGCQVHANKRRRGGGNASRRGHRHGEDEEVIRQRGGNTCTYLPTSIEGGSQPPLVSWTPLLSAELASAESPDCESGTGSASDGYKKELSKDLTKEP